MNGKVPMSKRILIFALCALFALIFAVGCGGNNDVDDADADTAQPNPVIREFIDENQEMLEMASQDHLEAMGPGGTVNFFAGSGDEFIYFYTMGPGPSVHEVFEDESGDLSTLKDYIAPFVEDPANVEMYQNLAGDLAELIGLDSLTVTVFYYDGQGEYIISRSFDSP